MVIVAAIAENTILSLGNMLVGILEGCNQPLEQYNSVHSLNSFEVTADTQHARYSLRMTDHHGASKRDGCGEFGPEDLLPALDLLNLLLKTLDSHEPTLQFTSIMRYITASLAPNWGQIPNALFTVGMIAPATAI